MRKIVAEFIGTAVLVLFACGTAVVTECTALSVNTAYLLTALAFGLVIVAMAYSIGSVSGCHINPAVSLAMLVSGRMKPGEFFAYIVAQCTGAIAGAAVLGALCGWDCGFGANGLYRDNALASLVVEAILTFVFVLVILCVTAKKENGNVAGLVIGLTLTLVHIFGIHFTGTSVNPARSLGTAIFAGGEALKNVWVFIVGPAVGGFLAAMCYTMIKSEEVNV